MAAVISLDAARARRRPSAQLEREERERQDKIQRALEELRELADDCAREAALLRERRRILLASSPKSRAGGVA